MLETAVCRGMIYLVPGDECIFIQKKKKKKKLSCERSKISFFLQTHINSLYAFGVYCCCIIYLVDVQVYLFRREGKDRTSGYSCPYMHTWYVPKQQSLHFRK